MEGQRSFMRKFSSSATAISFGGDVRAQMHCLWELTCTKEPVASVLSTFRTVVAQALNFPCAARARTIREHVVSRREKQDADASKIKGKFKPHH